jgi:phosphatidylinositol alpha-1,6-mannosyltransferase
MHVMALVTDGFGGFGGIARYNQDFLTALSASSAVEGVSVLPRRTPGRVAALPEKIAQTLPISSRTRYAMEALRRTAVMPRDTVVFCGHILMAPLAMAVAFTRGFPVWLQTHGLDAWEMPSSHVRSSAERATLVTTVSRFTRRRMVATWWRRDPNIIRVLPNTVSETFTPGPPPSHLVERWGLQGKKVLLSISRMGIADRYKGQDRIIAALPAIRVRHPDGVFLIGGDGEDVLRLKRLAIEAGVGEHVRFLGHVPSADLVDYYRCADVFVMPSTKEGFGIVFLEAAACGVHVVGGRLDGSWDALREGIIGDGVDPTSQDEIIETVCQALSAKERQDPTLVSVFSREQFTEHVSRMAELAVEGRAWGA